MDTQITPKQVLAMLLPTLLIGAGYSAWVVLGEPAGEDAWRRTKTEVEALRMQAPNDARLASLRDEKQLVQEEVDREQKTLDGIKQRATRFCQPVPAPLEQMRVLDELATLLKRRGLYLTRDGTPDDEKPALGRSLVDSQRAVLQAVSDSQSGGESTVSGPIPFDPRAIPSDIPLDELQAASNASRRVSDTQLNLRQLRLWGTFAQMQAALNEAKQSIPESFVIGLSIERSEAEPNSKLLAWTLSVHLQPSPEIRANVPEDPDGGNRIAEARPRNENTPDRHDVTLAE